MSAALAYMGATHTPHSTSRIVRKRKAHTKSRKGCRNCKLRGVKCDETKPGCQKCTSYGVNCNYRPSVPDLQFSTGTAAAGHCRKSEDLVKSSLTSRVPPGFMPTICDGESTLLLDNQILDRLFRFQKRTVLTLGTPKGAQLYKTVLVDLTFTSPILMHVVQAMTSIHERYLSGVPDARQTVAETYHLARSASLFNQKLSAPLRLEDRDAVWCSSAILGVIAFSSIEVSTPEKSWPLKRSEPRDLDWMAMSKNKGAIWRLTDPFRANGPLHSLAEDFQTTYNFLTEITSSIKGIPPEFAALCGIHEKSSAANNPYFEAIHLVSSLIGVQYTQDKVLQYLFFLSNMQPEYKKLLQEKDPRALLIIAYWYAVGWNSSWWIERRARLELPAICLYLERYHADQKAIHELLKYPKMHCGLLGECVVTHP